MNTQLLDDLVRLRTLVAALGEAPNFSWWKSQFLAPIGLRFLDRLYPRSTFAVAVRSASEAARQVHDTSIGVGQVFHLFRLPLDEERRIEIMLRDSARDLQDAVAPALGERASLLASLERLATNVPTKAPAGPQEVGKLRDWQGGKLLGTMAGLYLVAFRGDTRAFPYVKAE